MYGRFGKIKTHPGKRDEMVEILLRAADGLSEFEGCYLYVVNKDKTDPDTIWVMEAWRSQDDHRASLALAETQAMIANARPLIADLSGGMEFNPVGGKGLTDMTD
ncbi:MAG: antibiotic biosynthesis monooxygenase [Anaerolineae bacterium]|nr:antibiotic biosynthesis monooxygenase [Anaerolineae bacterium]